MKRGITLLEVLLAILVASVGLLGAIAVFPVALAQARKGKLADVTAVAGESAIASFKVHGMHERSRWLAWDQTNQQTIAVPANFQQSNSPYFGYAFCIDPMLFAHNAADDPANGATWARFPAVPQTASAVRMVRLNLTNGNPLTVVPMNEVQSDFAFRISDELIYDRPDDNSLPAIQRFTKSTSIPIGRRQEEGRLTWFATLVPKHEVQFFVNESDVITGLKNPSAPLGDEYVLSIVICRDRASGEALHVNDPANVQHPWNEWTAKVLATDWHSGGIGGGEVTITTNDPATDATFNAEQYLGLKHGQWVLLGRTIPTAAMGVQHFSWYRVSDAGDTISSGNRWQQDVSLVGPDWPCDILAPAGTNEECTVTIMPSVVHVYERTIKVVP